MNEDFKLCMCLRLCSSALLSTVQSFLHCDNDTFPNTETTTHPNAVVCSTPASPTIEKTTQPRAPQQVSHHIFRGPCSSRGHVRFRTCGAKILKRKVPWSWSEGHSVANAIINLVSVPNLSVDPGSSLTTPSQISRPSQKGSFRIMQKLNTARHL